MGETDVHTYIKCVHVPRTREQHDLTDKTMKLLKKSYIRNIFG